MSSFNTLKDLYQDGYRCIYCDKIKNNHTIYLKNFDIDFSTPLGISNVMTDYSCKVKVEEGSIIIIKNI